MKERNSSIELLRILAMIMIVFHHFAVHGGFDWSIQNSLSISHFWYNLIFMGGKIGVDVFVLISGFFLIKNNDYKFNFKRIFKFWGQLFFYSIIISIIFSFMGIIHLEVKDYIRIFFPISFSGWWFASTYFVLYLIHPFLNKLLYALDKKQYQKLLVLLVICWSVIPTFITSEYEGNNLLWFITLYCISGYARIHGFNPKFNAKHYLMLFLVIASLTYLSSIAFVILGIKYSIFASHSTYFYGQNKLSVLLISLTLFMTFINIKMKYHKWINVIASATFGVYLIHENGYIRTFLWNDVFKNNQFQESLMLIPYSIICVVVVYVICTIIDLLRQMTFEKIYLKFLNKCTDTILKPFIKICDICKNIVFGK